MREFKFRAWDKEEKEILELVTVGCTRKDSWGSLYIKDNIINGFDHRNYDIMQYTGLKDKNGIEIYEGDILKHIDFYSNQTTVNVVYMKYGSLVFDVKVGDFVYDVPLYSIHPYESRGYENIYEDILEVIGNIYQNPEFLEVTE